MTYDALLRAAEDHFLHGQLLSPWITDYVDLEESLAVGSIAQEEFAHAATLLDLAGYDIAGRDYIVFERQASEWWPARLLGLALPDWPATALRGLLLSAAAVVRSRRQLGDQNAAVRAAASVLLAEQELHVTHWSRWARLLGQDPRTSSELRNRATEVARLGDDLFGACPGALPAPDRAEMHGEWRELVCSVLDDAGAGGIPVPGEPVDRSPGDSHPDFAGALATVRSLRTGVDDGVRGVYR